MFKIFGYLYFFILFSIGANAQKIETFELPGTGPHLITFEQGNRPDFTNVNAVLTKFYPMNKGYVWKPKTSETDAFGITHVRGEIYFNTIKVFGSQLIVHCKEGKILDINGRFYEVENQPITINPEIALKQAMDASNAELFMWEEPAEEAFLKAESNDSMATYYPTPSLAFVPYNFDFTKSFVSCYEVKIYTKKPLSHKAYYIDANNGNLVATQDLMMDVHDTGTAVTAYSGSKTIYTDSTGSSNFRLRDSIRSVLTYNMKRGTNYGAAVDFTDTDNFWNNININEDEVATDAHWGAEMTFDYYLKEHNRNSYDNNGASIKSYVHYNSNYDNAFWDGSRMTYGDGNTFKPLTSIDVCGHEITHAVTTNTAGLIYSYESGALNESFSDIFGNTIEAWARPTQHSWIIGEDITTSGTGLRSMSNPNLKGHPKYYKGVSWRTGGADNGGVHSNSGVQNYWYYLLCEGDTGVNEKGDAYQVQKIGISSAEKIAYRNLAIYLTPSSNYSEARIYSIKSAADIFGQCSKEVIATTNAWYTVGVGAKYDSSTVKADFTADTLACKTSQAVQFYNKSTNYKECIWSFGDLDTSNQFDPSHLYKTYGQFDVKLKVKSCFGNIWDSLTKVKYVRIDSTIDICNAVLMPKLGIDSVNICSGFIYDEGGESNYKQNQVTYLKVTSKGADSIVLTFLDLNYEVGFDTLTLYKGAPIKGNEIGKYFNSVLPNGGAPMVIYSDYISFRQWSDPFLTGRGFKAKFKAYKQPLQVSVNNDTITCKGTGVTLSAMGSGGYLMDYLYVWNKDTLTNSYFTRPNKDSVFSVQLHDLCMKEMVQKTVKVTVLDSLHLVVPKDTLICAGQSVSYNLTGTGGKPSNYIFNWNNGIPDIPNPTFTPTKDTVYTIILSDNCTVKNDTGRFAINVRPALQIKVIAMDTVACQNETLTLYASGSGGDTINRNIYWEQAKVFANSIKITPTISGWYTATVSDQCGQSKSDSIYITRLANLTLKKSNDTLICLGSNTLLNVTPLGGDVNSYQYLWNNALPDTASYYVLGDFAKKYFITLKDGCSPSVLDSIYVDVMPALKLQKLRDTILCFGQSNTYSAIGSGGKTSTHLYSWDNSLGTGANKNMQPTITTNYQVVLSDGCSIKNDTQNVTISVRTALTINAVASPNEVCEGQKAVIKLNVNGGKTPITKWVDGVVIAKDSIIVNPDLIKNNYFVKVSDGCSNPDSMDVTIVVNPLPSFKISADKLTICLGDSVRLTHNYSNPASYNWTVSDGATNTASNYLWKPAKDGLFTAKLAITDLKNCTGVNDTDLTINVLPKPLAKFSFNPTNPNIDAPLVTFNNQSTFASLYAWDFGDGFTDFNFNSNHSYTDTGSYRVILTIENQIGCIDTNSQTIRIKPVYKVFMPTAFSPNADGKNDFIKPIISAVQDYTWQVFDRWGVMVFSSKNENESWDGKLQNQALSDGTYIYLLNVLDINGRLHHEQGSFLLLR